MYFLAWRGKRWWVMRSYGFQTSRPIASYRFKLAAQIHMRLIQEY